METVKKRGVVPVVLRVATAVIALVFASYPFSDAYPDNPVISGNITPYAIAVNPQTDMIYIANIGLNTVSVVNGLTNTIITTIKVGALPHALAVNSITNTIYVAGDSGAVSVINGATNTVTTTINVKANGDFVAMAVNPNTNTIYVVDYYNESVDVINGFTNTVTAAISLPLNYSPAGIALDANTNMIYVSAVYLNWEIFVINGATNSVTKTIVGDFSANGIAVNPNTNTIYIVGGVALWTIDGATDAITKSVSISPPNPYTLAANPNTNRIYVDNYYGNALDVIDGYSDTLIATIAVGDEPLGIAVNPSTDTIYVGNSGMASENVSVISGSTDIDCKYRSRNLALRSWCR